MDRQTGLNFLAESSEQIYARAESKTDQQLGRDMVLTGFRNVLSKDRKCPLSLPSTFSHLNAGPT